MQQRTPLHRATSKGDTEAVKALLKARANVNAKHVSGIRVTVVVDVVLGRDIEVKSGDGGAALSVQKWHLPGRGVLLGGGQETASHPLHYFAVCGGRRSA